MIILDENIPESQRQLLRSWRIHIRQVGPEIGHQGMKDKEIISLLHRFPRSTLFTRDLGFYDPRLHHADYCLVYLSVGQYEVASFIRRFLRHSVFKTQAKRNGAVIRLSQIGLSVWCLGQNTEQKLKWTT